MLLRMQKIKINFKNYCPERNAEKMNDVPDFPWLIIDDATKTLRPTGRVDDSFLCRHCSKKIQSVYKSAMKATGFDGTKKLAAPSTVTVRIDFFSCRRPRLAIDRSISRQECVDNDDSALHYRKLLFSTRKKDPVESVFAVGFTYPRPSSWLAVLRYCRSQNVK